MKENGNGVRRWLLNGTVSALFVLTVGWLSLLTETVVSHDRTLVAREPAAWLIEDLEKLQSELERVHEQLTGIDKRCVRLEILLTQHLEACRWLPEGLRPETERTNGG